MQLIWSKCQSLSRTYRASQVAFLLPLPWASLLGRASDSLFSSHTGLPIPSKCLAQPLLVALLFLLPRPDRVPSRTLLLLIHSLNQGEGKLGQLRPLTSVTFPSPLPTITPTPLKLPFHPEICSCTFILKPLPCTSLYPSAPLLIRNIFKSQIIEITTLA